MRPCTWPKGCNEWAYDQGPCYYHRKVADGLVEMHPATLRAEDRALKSGDRVVDDETTGLRGLLSRLEDSLLFRPKKRGSRGTKR